MRRFALVASVACVMGAVAISVAGGATPRTRTVNFVGTATGNAISATQAAFKYHDSVFGNAAGVQTTSFNGSVGTDKVTVYYGRGVGLAKDTFTIGTPDANGIASVTGQGHDQGGTGIAKGVTSTYTLNGTYDTKSGIYKVTLRGKYKIPR